MELLGAMLGALGMLAALPHSFLTESLGVRIVGGPLGQGALFLLRPRPWVKALLESSWTGTALTLMGLLLVSLGIWGRGYRRAAVAGLAASIAWCCFLPRGPGPERYWNCFGSADWRPAQGLVLEDGRRLRAAGLTLPAPEPQRWQQGRALLQAERGTLTHTRERVLAFVPGVVPKTVWFAIRPGALPKTLSFLGTDLLLSPSAREVVLTSEWLPFAAYDLVTGRLSLQDDLCGRPADLYLGEGPFGSELLGAYRANLAKGHPCPGPDRFEEALARRQPRGTGVPR